MKTKEYNQFINVMDIEPPPTRMYAKMVETSRNWFMLHQTLATMEANKASLEMCKQFMYVELNREGGPRWHIMNRLYKRYSNLRRKIETVAMMKCLPEHADAAAAA